MFEQTSIYSQLNINLADEDDFAATNGQVFQAAYDLYSNIHTTDGFEEIEERLYNERNQKIYDDLMKMNPDMGNLGYGFKDTYRPIDASDIKVFNRALAGDEKSIQAANNQRRKFNQYKAIKQQIDIGDGKYLTDEQVIEEATKQGRQIYDASNSILARSDSWVSEAAGSFVGMMTDPVQQIGLLLGGQQVAGGIIAQGLKMGVQSAAATVAVETIVQPEIIKNMERIGVDYSAEDALKAIGFAAAGGFVFGGVIGSAGAALTKKFGTAGNLSDDIKSIKDKLQRDIEAGRQLRSDANLAALEEAELLEQTINRVVKYTGRDAEAGEVLNRLVQLKAAETQIFKQISGAKDTFDIELNNWSKSLEADVRYKLPVKSLERIKDTIVRVESDAREYFKWAEPEVKLNARQQKKADQKNKDKSYTEPEKKRLTKQQKIERDQLLKGLKGALERHKKAVDSEKKLANMERGIIPLEVRQAAERKTGVNNYKSQVNEGQGIATKSKEAFEAEQVRALAFKKMGQQNIIKAMQEVPTPPTKAAAKTLSNDYLDPEILESDKMLFTVADDIGNDIETPIKMVTDGDETETIYVNGKALLERQRADQEALEKVQLCMAGRQQ